LYRFVEVASVQAKVMFEFRLYFNLIRTNKHAKWRSSGV